MNGVRFIAFALALTLGWGQPTKALASDFRVGILVGNNMGHGGMLPLVFAEKDAEKMRDLLARQGNFDELALLEGRNRNQVKRELDRLRASIQTANASGEDTLLLFYYSGHGDDQALQLGPSRVLHDELRAWLDDSGADVRIAMLDACHSGSAIRNKGGRPAPAHDFAVEVEKTQGTAILTSSAASELSQESAEVGGGFFTHYLHSALLGAADANRDGLVTLTETYAYVHAETAFSTRVSSASQTPGYDFDLIGSGDLVLTELDHAQSSLRFDGGMDGVLAIWDESRKRYVAEIHGDQPNRITIRPGTYFVHRRMPAWVDESKYVVRKGETRSVVEEDFVRLPYEQTAARGDLNRQVRRSKIPDLSLRLFVGGRTFGRNESFVPQTAAVGAQARWIGNGRLVYTVDWIHGTGAEELRFEGLAPVEVDISTNFIGTGVGLASRPRILRWGAGARAAGFGLQRRFPNRDLPEQMTVGLAPGVDGWVGIHAGRLSFDLQANLHVLLTRFDDQTFPASTDVGFVLGYRF